MEDSASEPKAEPIAKKYRLMIGKRSIYEWADFLSNPGTRTKVEKEANEELARSGFNRSDSWIFEPELSREGLSLRKSMIAEVSITLLVASMALLGIDLVLGFLFGVDQLFYDVGVTLIVLSMYILVLRVFPATWDEIRMEIRLRNKIPLDDFKISKRAYIRWYDFAIPLTFRILLILGILQ